MRLLLRSLCCLATAGCGAPLAGDFSVEVLAQQGTEVRLETTTVYDALDLSAGSLVDVALSTEPAPVDYQRALTSVEDWARSGDARRAALTRPALALAADGALIFGVGPGDVVALTALSHTQKMLRKSKAVPTLPSLGEGPLRVVLFPLQQTNILVPLIAHLVDNAQYDPMIDALLVGAGVNDPFPPPVSETVLAHELWHRAMFAAVYAPHTDSFLALQREQLDEASRLIQRTDAGLNEGLADAWGIALGGDTTMAARRDIAGDFASAVTLSGLIVGNVPGIELACSVPSGGNVLASPDGGTHCIGVVVSRALWDAFGATAYASAVPPLLAGALPLFERAVARNGALDAASVADALTQAAPAADRIAVCDAVIERLSIARLEVPACTP